MNQPLLSAAPVRASCVRRASGLTLVELMVALVIGLVVAAAAVAALLVARNGFTTVDSTAQLRENARFSADLMQRLAVQAGFEDVAGRGFSVVPPAERPPAIRGWDDSILNIADLPDGLTNGSRSSGCGGITDTSCVNGSDILMIRFWGTSPGANPTVADGSMINCAGVGEPEGTELATSIFHIVRSAAGEPTLACTYRDTAGVWTTVPLVPGVEAMQVLYGVDNVTPGTAPSGDTDSVPDRYLRASQLVVAGDAAATLANWRRVRSLRIGLLFRGPVGGAQDRDATAVTYDVLGDGFSVSGDTLSQLEVPADGRMRQAMVFNVHLRNP